MITPTNVLMPLVQKKQAAFHMQRILNEWMTQLNKKVKMIYTDRGGELVNTAMDKWCAERGIIHHKSPSRCHELNGRAENLNKRMNDRLRAMLYTYINVPKDIRKKLWAEGLMYLAHLHNVTLVRRLNMTPMQAFSGNIPDVSNLRTFGCKVYYRVSDEVRQKLDPKALPGVYLGPSYDGPGVRVLIHNDELKQRQWQVRIVRDVFTIESLTQRCGVEQKYKFQDGGAGPQILQNGESIRDPGPTNQEGSGWPPLSTTTIQIPLSMGLPNSGEKNTGNTPHGGVNQDERVQDCPTQVVQDATTQVNQNAPVQVAVETPSGSRAQIQSNAEGGASMPTSSNSDVQRHGVVQVPQPPTGQGAVQALAPSQVNTQSREAIQVAGGRRATASTTAAGDNIQGQQNPAGQEANPAGYGRMSSSYSSGGHIQEGGTPTSNTSRPIQEAIPDNPETPNAPAVDPQETVNPEIEDVDEGEQIVPAQRYSKRQRMPVVRFHDEPSNYLPRKGTYSQLFDKVGKANLAIPHRSVLQDEDENCEARFYEFRENVWVAEDFHNSEVIIAFTANVMKGKEVESLLSKVNEEKGKRVVQWDKVDPDKDTPDTFQQATNSKYREEWIEALIDEYKSLVSNTTWHLVSRDQVPRDKKVIPCKWVFKIKVDSDGYPVRFKCRLVAGGHKQVYGEDYDLTYAPVSRVTTLRVMLAVAAYREWKVHQIDIKTAFLHGDIDTDVYMEQPVGFSDDPNMVCKLDKCLYGLKQAPRAWYMKLTKYLSEELGFSVSEMDSSLWIKHDNDDKVYLAMVVDDICATGPNEQLVMKTLKQILNRFPGTHSGEMQWYIGMKVTWLPGEKSVILSQAAHIDNLLKKFEGKSNMFAPLSLPMKEGLHLFKSGSSDKPCSPILDTSKYPYRSLVGALNYLACSTRPDIAYSVNKLSKFLNEPRVEHWDVGINLLRYLKYTKNTGLKLGGGNEEGALCFCDASYGSFTDPASGDACVRATTGSVFLVNGGAVHWKSATQDYASRSTTDAEYRACCDATCDALWLQELLRDFNMVCRPFLIKNDSQGALCAICNNNVTQRTKHIARQVGFVRDYHKKALVKFEHIMGSDNVADVLTKALGGTKHRRFTKEMGMTPVGVTRPKKQSMQVESQLS
jgi:hypothetical protein